MGDRHQGQGEPAGDQPADLGGHLELAGLHGVQHPRRHGGDPHHQRQVPVGPAQGGGGRPHQVAPVELVEVDPPQPEGQAQARHRGCHHRQLQLVAPGGGGDHRDHRLTQHDDRKQTEPLGEVGGAESGKPPLVGEGGERHRQVHCQPHSPQHQLERARYPNGPHPRQRRQGNAKGVAVRDGSGRWVVVPGSQPEHPGPSSGEHVGDGEPGALLLQPLVGEHRHPGDGDHQQEDRQPLRGVVGLEAVEVDGGADPRPPHRQEGQAEAERHPRAGVLGEAVRQLGHHRHEDQVEEQLQPAGAPFSAFGLLISQPRRQPPGGPGPPHRPHRSHNRRGPHPSRNRGNGTVSRCRPRPTRKR